LIPLAKFWQPLQFLCRGSYHDEMCEECGGSRKVGEFGNECVAEETRPRCFVFDLPATPSFVLQDLRNGRNWYRASPSVPALPFNLSRSDNLATTLGRLFRMQNPNSASCRVGIYCSCYTHLIIHPRNSPHREIDEMTASPSPSKVKRSWLHC
jgi:hypothetical protein